MKRSLILLSVATLLVQSGCVTGRRAFEVPVPTGPASAVTKGRIFISSVTDNRVFQNKPSDPSVPSIDGDVTTMSAGQKDRMIGRQRGGFGKAFGDIALADNDTVTKKVRALVEEGLRRQGYGISNDPASPATMAVSVDEFWAWMTPGFFALTFEAKISATINFNDARGTTKVLVKCHGLNHGQVAKDGNWQEAYEPAFEEFVANLGTEINKAAIPIETASPAKPGSNLYAELKKLDELRKENILTEEEFHAQKQKLLEKN
jgi:hypothetical protein